MRDVAKVCKDLNILFYFLTLGSCIYKVFLHCTLKIGVILACAQSHGHVILEDIL